MRSNNTPIVYRSVKPGEEAAVADLVLKIFDEFIAPQYSHEGIAEFKKFVRADLLADRLKDGNLVILAESDRRIIGVIEMRENSHIALLFVEKSHQGKGIAKELLQKSLEICWNRKPDIQRITVNSSPNAFAAYQKMGFKNIEGEKVVNGIRFIPMEMEMGGNGGLRCALYG